MSSDKQIIRSAGIVGGSTLISRILGLVRDIVMTHFFGTGFVAEAFYVALTFPALLRRLVGEGSLTVAFISIYTKYRKKHGDKEAQKLLETFWTLMVIVLAGLTLLGVLLSRFLVTLFTHRSWRANEEMFDLAVVMTMEMFPYLFMIGLVALSMGVLNSYKKFFSSAFHPVLFNLSWIGGILLLHERFEQPGLSAVIGVLVGGLLQLAFQIPFLWNSGMRFIPRFNFGHPAIKKIGWLMVPSTFAVGVVQFNSLVATYFVTKVDGGKSSLFYAQRLSEFPYAIFALALATVVLPVMAEQASTKDHQGVANTLDLSLRLGAFIIIPASIGLAVISGPFIHLAFEHGEFTADDTARTSGMLIMFCVGLWAMAGLRLVVQTFYAFEDMKTPLKAASLGMAVNLVGCFMLPRFFGVGGIPAAISLAAIINLFYLAYHLPVIVGRVDFYDVQRTAVLSVLASMPMAGLALFVRRLSLWEEPGMIAAKIGLLAAVVAGGILLYALPARILGMPELRMLMDAFSGKIGKNQE